MNKITKRVRIIILSLLVITMFSVTVPMAFADITIGNSTFDGEEALDNEGFETSLSSSNWIREYGSYSYDYQVKRHGYRSLKMERSSGKVQLRQNIDSTPIYQITKFCGDSSSYVWIDFSFFFQNDDSEKAAAKIQTRRGLSNWQTPVTSTYIEGSDESGDLRWARVSVRAKVYSDTSYIKVWIIGDQTYSGDRDIWFDDAEITISDVSKVSTTYGKVSLATRIYDVRYQPGTNEQYLEVTFAFAAGAERYGSYFPYKITIHVEMLPKYLGWWWQTYTTQDGDVNVVRIGETIEGGNPAIPQIASSAHEVGAVVAAAGLDGLKDVAMATLVVCGMGEGAALAIGVLAGVVISQILEFYKESINPFDTDANGDYDYRTQVIWDYWPVSGGPFNPQLPTKTSNVHEVTWIFKKNHPEYGLDLRVQVDWGELRLTTYGIYLYHMGTTYLHDYLWAPQY